MKIVLASLACLLTAIAHADTFRMVEVRDLVEEEGTNRMVHSSFAWSDRDGMILPWVRSEGVLESYVVMPEGDARSVSQDQLRVVMRLKDDKEIRGFLDVKASPDEDLFQAKEFRFDPKKFPEIDAKDFEKARKDYAIRMVRANMPGGMWYRHLAGNVSVADGSDRVGGLGTTFLMASGGRAVAENLALDRELILATEKQGEMVELEKLRGVRIPAMDWKERLQAGDIQVDRLALMVPEDQHVIIFPSFDSMFDLEKVMDEEGIPVIQTYAARHPFRGLAARYKEQMGLKQLEVLVKALKIQGNVAVTGGDPYFATGTDVAIIFEAAQVEVVYPSLIKAMEVQSLLRGADDRSVGEIVGYENEDRSFSVYAAKLEGAVVISNSLVQVKRVLGVVQKDVPALGLTDEYRYFRQKYAKDEEEDAYVFLSDATIRRWCSPAVRISASRRLRALAALGELTAMRLAGKPISDDFKNLLGKVSADRGVVRSEIYQTMDFLTPICELEIEKVTPSEAEGYEQWRDGYESGWAKMFDPIAFRLKMDEEAKQLELAVIPLTIGSSYREIMSITGVKKPERGAMVAHSGAKAFFSFAIDHESTAFRELGKLSLEFLPSLKADVLGWVGDSVSVYLEDSFFWDAVRLGDGSDVLEANVMRLPLGMRVESRDSLQLAAFIAAMRRYVEESAPDLLDWKVREHGGSKYVAVLSKENDGASGSALYYAATKRALLMALDERVLLRAMDREKGQVEVVDDHVQMAFDGDLASLAFGMWNEPENTSRWQSWSMLPILNEWRRRDPAKDPVSEYEAAFREKVYCPGGRGYRWNEEEQTMESVVFGFPAKPRGEEEVSKLSALSLISGMKFEDDGVVLCTSLRPLKPRVLHESDDVKVKENAIGYPRLKDLVTVAAGLKLTYHVDETDVERPYKKTKKVIEVKEKDGRILVRSERMIDADGEEDDFQSLVDESLSVKGYEVIRITNDYDRMEYLRPQLLVPPVLAAGVVEWNDYEVLVTEEDGEVSRDAGRMKVRIVGTEKVEVPAGVFENCVRIDTEGDYLSGGEIGRVKDSTWWCPQIGVVKMTWENDFGRGSEVLEKIVRP